MRGVIFTILMAVCFYAKAQFVAIPDTNFRNKLMQLYPLCFNGNEEMDTTCSDIVNENTLLVNLTNSVSIDGVQYFDNLDSLFCYDNLIVTLPNLPTTLKNLNCSNNQITSLPTLPSTITKLDCSLNQVTSLPSLPTQLKELYCGGNLLVGLPILPNSLLELSFGANLIPIFPALPNSLTMLDCSANLFLANIPNQLPPNLTSFNCSALQLAVLPVLPVQLRILSCGNNLLTALPHLPDSLTELYCSLNKIINLPVLPKSIRTLYCYNNLLTSLPALPDSLITLRCQYNLLTTLPSFSQKLHTLDISSNFQLDCLPLLPPTLQFLTFTGTNLSCIPNNVNGLATGLPLCPNGATCGPRPTLGGKVFRDINNNGLFDNGVDNYLDQINIANSMAWRATTKSSGEYQIKLDSGVVNIITCLAPGPYFTISPSSQTVTPTNIQHQGNNYDFAIYLNPNMYDLKVNIAKSTARPGFSQLVSTTVKNDGTEDALNATLKLLKPIGFNMLNSNPPVSQQVGDTLIWNNVDVEIFQQKTFSAVWQIPANISIGTPFEIEAWIIPVNTDTTPLNNHTIDDGTIQGSFDPNDKTVSKQTLDENTTDELKYTVCFQNTGTDTAFNIMIRDELSNNLDISAFQMLGASHNYIYQIREKGLLEIFFQNILLPDSNINEPLSHGFFQYVIKSKPNLTINDSINNTASIYFDFNAPIVTNTVTTKVIVTGMAEVSKIDANIYPNPTTGKAIVSISESSGTLTLSDMKGSIISVNSIKNGSEIDLSRLESGIFIGKIETEKGFKVFKIVKQD